MFDKDIFQQEHHVHELYKLFHVGDEVCFNAITSPPNYEIRWIATHMWFQKEISLKARSRGFHVITHELESQIPDLPQSLFHILQWIPNQIYKAKLQALSQLNIGNIRFSIRLILI